MKNVNEYGYETATLAGGCFWCLEAVFDRLAGVINVVSGYSGGQTANPSYQQVCSGSAGHAEVVQVTFDPQVISFSGLLEVFFNIHDPTTLNRQGADVGTQYRSAIFHHTEEQKMAAVNMAAALNASGRYRGPIVTEIVPFSEFYPAEDYHQDYFASNPNQPYCRFVVAPKVEKFAHNFAGQIKPQV